MTDKQLISGDKIDYITSTPMSGRAVFLLPNSKADVAAGYVRLKSGVAVYFGINCPIPEHPEHTATEPKSRAQVLEHHGSLDGQWPCRSAARLIEAIFAEEMESVSLYRSAIHDFALDVQSKDPRGPGVHPVGAVFGIVSEGRAGMQWRQIG